MSGLSQAVLNICKANYDKNCGKCPLRPSCVTNQPIRTQQDLDNYRNNLNNHAARMMKGENA